MVERKLPKLQVGVRFPSPALRKPRCQQMTARLLSRLGRTLERILQVTWPSRESCQGQWPGGRGVAFREPETPGFTPPGTPEVDFGTAFEWSDLEASSVSASGLDASVTSGIGTAFADAFLPELLER